MSFSGLMTNFRLPSPAQVEQTGQIFDIKRFATHDGPGIRSTVFFTRCPLRCAWCHNPEAFALCDSNHVEEQGKIRTVTTDSLIKEVERDIAYYDRSGGGVTLSGGEPLSQPEFVQSFLTVCRERDLHTVIDTCGSVVTPSIEMAAKHADLILYDLKAIDDTVHMDWTGVGNSLILTNLMKLNELDVNVWIRMPLIPGVNDDMASLEAAIQFLQNTRFRRVSLLPYHRIGEGKYQNLGLKYGMTGIQPHQPGQIEQMRDLFASAGFDPHIGS